MSDSDDAQHARPHAVSAGAAPVHPQPGEPKQAAVPEITRILWRTDHWMHCYHHYSTLVTLMTTNLSFALHTGHGTHHHHQQQQQKQPWVERDRIVGRVGEVLDQTEYESFAGAAVRILQKCDRALPLIGMLVHNELKSALASDKYAVFRGNSFVSAVEKAFVSAYLPACRNAHHGRKQRVTGLCVVEQSLLRETTSRAPSATLCGRLSTPKTWTSRSTQRL